LSQHRSLKRKKKRKVISELPDDRSEDNVKNQTILSMCEFYTNRYMNGSLTSKENILNDHRLQDYSSLVI